MNKQSSLEVVSTNKLGYVYVARNFDTKRQGKHIQYVDEKLNKLPQTCGCVFARALVDNSSAYSITVVVVR